MIQGEKPTTIIFAAVGSPQDFQHIEDKCKEKPHNSIREIKIYAWSFPAKHFEENKGLFHEFGGIRNRFQKGIAYLQYIIEKAIGGEGQPFSFNGPCPPGNTPRYTNGLYALDDFLANETRL